MILSYPVITAVSRNPPTVDRSANSLGRLVGQTGLEGSENCHLHKTLVQDGCRMSMSGNPRIRFSYETTACSGFAVSDFSRTVALTAAHW